MELGFRILFATNSVNNMLLKLVDHLCKDYEHTNNNFLFP